MAPTEILAQQHFRALSGLLKSTGINVELLTGSVKGKARTELLGRLANGETGLLVGTHALFSETVVFKRLGLVVTDEQHRFGVAQRAALCAKGAEPHVLVMSATPIPRTLALMIYGDLDISVLNELPPGRQKIDTYAVSGDKRLRALKFLRRHIDAGRQCYIVCPLVNEGPNDMASVVEYSEYLKKSGIFDGSKVGTLYGKMKPCDKDAVMHDFAEGQLDLLVSTTVVEVGVDVPNATVMLIENAERYGLSQLHQLRGRVGRGREKSICILISDAQNEESQRRVRVMCETNDGFKIADEDLKLRGPGDFFGSRQHGLPELKLADLSADMETLRCAQLEATGILASDPHLLSHRGLLAELNQLFDSCQSS